MPPSSESILAVMSKERIRRSLVSLSLLAFFPLYPLATMTNYNKCFMHNLVQSPHNNFAKESLVSTSAHVPYAFFLLDAHGSFLQLRSF